MRRGILAVLLVGAMALPLLAHPDPKPQPAKKTSQVTVAVYRVSGMT